MMLIKTTSNILMIPLTQLLKKIMFVFEKYELMRKSVDDLQDYEEIKKINIDVEWLRRKLNWLVSKGFLDKDSEKRFKDDGKAIPKPVYIYSYKKMHVLNIPEWENISSFTWNSNNNKNTSNTTNTQKIEKIEEKQPVIELNEVNYYKRSITEQNKITKSDDMDSFDQMKMEGRIKIKDKK